MKKTSRKRPPPKTYRMTPKAIEELERLAERYRLSRQRIMEEAILRLAREEQQSGLNLSA